MCRVLRIPWIQYSKSQIHYIMGLCRSCPPKMIWHSWKYRKSMCCSRKMSVSNQRSLQFIVTQMPVNSVRLLKIVRISTYHWAILILMIVMWPICVLASLTLTGCTIWGSGHSSKGKQNNGESTYSKETHSTNSDFGIQIRTRIPTHSIPIRIYFRFDAVRQLLIIRSINLFLFNNSKREVMTHFSF